MSHSENPVFVIIDKLKIDCQIFINQITVKKHLSERTQQYYLHIEVKKNTTSLKKRGLTIIIVVK